MKAVIFAAGKSTRTYPLTLTRPKALLKIANKSILEHQIEALSGLADEVIVVVGYRKEMITEKYTGGYGGMELSFVEQQEQLGTGHALLQCRDRIDGPFLAMNGDDLYAAADLQSISALEQAVLAKSVDDPARFGVFETDDDGRIVQVIEKPPDDRFRLANTGAYKFTPEVFGVLEELEPSERGEIELTSAVQALAEKGAVAAVEAAGLWLSIGHPWDLITANAQILDSTLEEDVRGEVSAGAEVNGVLALGEGSVVRSGVVIDGPVCIGRDCVIGPNAWIRPGTTIGDGCRVGMAVEIKNSILMDRAAVPHLSYVGDSVIGEDANLGCGTITANFRHDSANHRSLVKGEMVDTGLRKLGAIIGDGVHTGINTSIYPGRKLWPGTSTLPGSVVREDVEE